MIDRITCPIGLPEITGKEPAVIAVGVGLRRSVLAMQRQDGARRSHGADLRQLGHETPTSRSTPDRSAPTS